MEELIKGLTEAIGYFKETDYLWVGIIEHKKAKKYKFEALWFYGDENYDFEEGIETQIKNSESRMCENLPQAYSYAFEAIKTTLSKDSTVVITITDLVNGVEI